ncbi:MAG: ribulose-phosphate 3-epimerase [Ignavibacteria bacterium GWF2_33_9]|nr:MAG: ribulose-phosphate 3-epimerase [Ignavibacteria bacterium GWF2_33_9]
MQHQIKIAPSLLSADFGNLQKDIKLCEEGGADILHLDIMDGHFVPNITFGPIMLKYIRKYSQMPVSTHLMIAKPDEYIPQFAELGSEMISFHAEAVPHIHRSLSFIRSFGKKAGIALNPVTPIEYAFEAAEYCDFILLMTVNPGFGGQKFIPNYFARVEKLKNFLIKNGLEHIEIEVDGGVKIENCKSVSDAGANILVSGSGIFSGDIVQNLIAMRKALE